MTDLDYAEVARQIMIQRPDGFAVSRITVNFDKTEHNLAPRIQERCCRVFEEKAAYYLNDDLEVAPDDSIPKLWDYEIVCENCGNSPQFDSQAEEHYCPVCTTSIFDY